jgi:hypothetical protein
MTEPRTDRDETPEAADRLRSLFNIPSITLWASSKRRGNSSPR